MFLKIQIITNEQLTNTGKITTKKSTEEAKERTIIDAEKEILELDPDVVAKQPLDKQLLHRVICKLSTIRPLECIDETDWRKRLIKYFSLQIMRNEF